MRQLIIFLVGTYLRSKHFLNRMYKNFQSRESARQRAISKAKRKHKKTGRRYRVFFIQKKYQVLSRHDLQKKKHQKIFNRDVNSTNMDLFKTFDTNSLTPKPV